MSDQGPSIDVHALLHAAHGVEADVEAKLRDVGLSGAKFAALRALADAGEPLPLSQLADRLACVKSNITQLIDRLETDGLVTRVDEPRDRRTKLAALTTSGQTAVQQGLDAFQRAERELRERLTCDEAEQLRMLLAKLRPVVRQ